MSDWGPRYWHAAMGTWVYVTANGIRESVWTKTAGRWIESPIAIRNEHGRWETNPAYPQWWAQE